jgi:hypothetical protein
MKTTDLRPVLHLQRVTDAKPRIVRAIDAAAAARLGNNARGVPGEPRDAADTR